MIAAPISITGGMIASGACAVTNHAARMSIKVGADIVGGFAAGAGTKALHNVVEGKTLSDGVLR